MQPFFLTAFVVSTSLLAWESASVVAFTESTHSVRGFARGGDVLLSVRRAQVDVQYSPSKRGRGDVIVVYDPLTGHYLWELTRLRSDADPYSYLSELESGRWAVYSGQDEMDGFFFPGELDIQRGTSRAASLDAASAEVIATIGRRVSAGNDRLSDEAAEVPLYRAIGKPFACSDPGEQGFSPNCSFHAEKISSITREGDKWRLVIENRWAQEVILDSKFALVSTQRIETPAQ